MIGILTVAFLAAVLPNAVVLEPVANLYSKPSADADVVSQARYGNNVTLLEQKEGWGHIRTPDDYTGWIAMGALRLGPAYASNGRVAEVQSFFAHIYREASVAVHAPLVTVPFETALEVVGGPKEDGRWLEVRLPDGRDAWVQVGDVSLERKPLSVSEMIELSKRFLGFPYTWGGTSSYGYDCSGFIQMLERRRGIGMPRDAQPQADWSGVVPVERKNLEPGDLLYFGSSEKHITHTGLYLGESRFISATTYETPMVRIDSLDEPRWSRLLVAMRRVK
jgi:cell wall-associated NlpC family hydrolase